MKSRMLLCQTKKILSRSLTKCATAEKLTVQYPRRISSFLSQHSETSALNKAGVEWKAFWYFTSVPLSSHSVLGNISRPSRGCERPVGPDLSSVVSESRQCSTCTWPFKKVLQSSQRCICRASRCRSRVSGRPLRGVPDQPGTTSACPGRPRGTC